MKLCVSRRRCCWHTDSGSSCLQTPGGRRSTVLRAPRRACEWLSSKIVLVSPPTITSRWRDAKRKRCTMVSAEGEAAVCAMTTGRDDAAALNFSLCKLSQKFPPYNMWILWAQKLLSLCMLAPVAEADRLKADKLILHKRHQHQENRTNGMVVICWLNPKAAAALLLCLALLVGFHSPAADAAAAGGHFSRSRSAWPFQQNLNWTLILGSPSKANALPVCTPVAMVFHTLKVPGCPASQLDVANLYTLCSLPHGGGHARSDRCRL